MPFEKCRSGVAVKKRCSADAPRLSECSFPTRAGEVVYDGVGGDAITVESMKCCRFGARICIMGWAATPDVRSSSSDTAAAANGCLGCLREFWMVFRVF